MRLGQSVITYYRTDALYVANKAGGSKAPCDQKHGGKGYFSHFHTRNRNGAHVYFLVGG